jgi:hypothetical protein
MLRPIGSLPPTVYWRRRLMVLAPLVLIAITIYVLVNAGSGSSKDAASTSSPSPTPAGHSASAPGSTPHTSGAPSTHTSTAASTPAKSSTSPKSSTSASHAPAVPTACAPAALSVVAATGAPSYTVGTTPTLFLQVTNVGAVPCVEDLSDKQIEMRVYNGASRVWGSHDCQIAPNTPLETLPVKQPVRRSVVWTGLSSQPGCAGTRVRVGPGTYTLHVLLAGVEGKTAMFTLK